MLVCIILISKDSHIEYTTRIEHVLNIWPKFYISLQAALEKECPDIMKLGLLHVVGVRKATARKQPAFLSYEHKSLQEFGASKFVTNRLETAKNMKVSLDLYKH